MPDQLGRAADSTYDEQQGAHCRWRIRYLQTHTHNKEPPSYFGESSLHLIRTRKIEVYFGRELASGFEPCSSSRKGLPDQAIVDSNPVFCPGLKCSKQQPFCFTRGRNDRKEREMKEGSLTFWVSFLSMNKIIARSCKNISTSGDAALTIFSSVSLASTAGGSTAPTSIISTESSGS